MTEGQVLDWLIEYEAWRKRQRLEPSRRALRLLRRCRNIAAVGVLWDEWCEFLVEA